MNRGIRVTDRNSGMIVVAGITGSDGATNFVEDVVTSLYLTIARPSPRGSDAASTLLL